jgi:hypothetical protein
MPPITTEDIDRLKEIFVTRKECDDTTQELRNSMFTTDKGIVEIKTQLKMVLGLLCCVGGAVLTLVVKQFWGA